MPGNMKRIEGGGSSSEPKQTYEKNLSYLSGDNVISGLHQGIGSKEMGKLFVQIAPKVVGLVPGNIKTWEDRNTDNIGSKLNGPKNIKSNLKKQSDYKYKKATKKSNG
jgi:hypothetical protein